MHIASTSLNSKPPQTVNSRKQERLRFGSSPVTGFLHALEKQPLAELVFKDIAAFNAPKIIFSRTWKERWDTATLELSNTSITLLASLALPPLLRRVVSPLSQVAEDALKKQIPYANLTSTHTATKLARLGTSFGFFFPFAAAFWAAPFFRNWLTLKRTNNANFESIIGFDGVKRNGPQRSLQEEINYQKYSAWKIFGAGVGLGVASFAGLGLAARSVGKNAGKQLAKGFGSQLDQFLQRHPKGWNWVFNSFDLKGKAANQIEGMPAQLLFWGMPAYLGWVHGARSEHERRERLVQSANALFWFFAAPKITSLMWGGKFLEKAGKQGDWTDEFKNAISKNLLPNEKFEDAFKNKVKNLSYDDIKHFVGNGEAGKQALTRLKNWRFAVSGLGIPITALALVQLYNFGVTERKIKGMQPQPAQPPSPGPTFASNTSPQSNQPAFMPALSGNGYQMPTAYAGSYNAYPQKPAAPNPFMGNPNNYQPMPYAWPNSFSG
ncbi:MAG: hypothetical protein K0Q50_3035 [Vampirovibrio sp.]|jgi:hypothetical protein|nr:hypothetical protein [Vampirovibrio sp.]